MEQTLLIRSTDPDRDVVELLAIHHGNDSFAVITQNNTNSNSTASPPTYQALGSGTVSFLFREKNSLYFFLCLLISS